LYGSPAVEQQQQQQHVNPAFTGANPLDYRIPDVYGHQNEHTRPLTANPRMTPLYRKVTAQFVRKYCITFSYDA